MLVGAVASIRTVLTKSMKDKSDFYFDLINDNEKSFNFLDELTFEILEIE